MNLRYHWTQTTSFAILLGLCLCSTGALCQEAPSGKSVERAGLEKRYGWLKGQELGEMTTLVHQFRAPAGWARNRVNATSWADYLRYLPLRKDRVQVKLYNGQPVSMPSAGIVPMDLGERDLHQCADSVIRLHAEYLWQAGRADDAKYHYTSGDLASWKDYRQGKQLKVKGNKVVTVKRPAPSKTHKTYRRWLDTVFMYASTRSLHRDAKKITDPRTLQAGDFLLQGGSPGHVVMILDVVENKKGERAALIGQGYLPAREFHVIKSSGKGVLDGVWFVLDGEVDTVTWKPFKASEHAWRFKVQ